MYACYYLVKYFSIINFWIKGISENIYFCFTDYIKTFDSVDHNKGWKILKEMRIPDHLICLLRNVYAGQEATVRTGHGTTDWFQIRKGVRQGSILSPCLFNLYAEYIMRNATRWSTSWNQDCWEKSLLMKVKEESEKAGLNSTFKTLRSWHPVPSLHGK